MFKKKYIRIFTRDISLIGDVPSHIYAYIRGNVLFYAVFFFFFIILY